MACLTNILWAPMANLTVSAAMAGLTNVLWASCVIHDVQVEMFGMFVLVVILNENE